MHINISLRRRYGITSTRNSYLCLIQAHRKKQGTAIQRDANVGQHQTFNTVSERSDVKGQES